MPRYIDAETICFKGIELYDENQDILVSVSDVRKAIQMTPTADVVPRITAQWILHSDGSTGTCSECNRTQKNICDDDSYQNYCGCCGANMTGIDE